MTQLNKMKGIHHTEAKSRWAHEDGSLNYTVQPAVLYTVALESHSKNSSLLLKLLLFPGEKNQTSPPNPSQP